MNIHSSSTNIREEYQKLLKEPNLITERIKEINTKITEIQILTSKIFIGILFIFITVTINVINEDSSQLNILYFISFAFLLCVIKNIFYSIDIAFRISTNKQLIKTNKDNKDIVNFYTSQKLIDNANLLILLPPKQIESENSEIFTKFNFCKFITLCQLLNKQPNNKEINEKLNKFIDAIKSIGIDALLKPLSETQLQIISELECIKELCEKTSASNELYETGKNLKHLFDATYFIKNIQEKLKIQSFILKQHNTSILYYKQIQNEAYFDDDIKKQLNDNPEKFDDLLKSLTQDMNNIEHLMPNNDLLYLVNIKQSYDNIKNHSSLDETDNNFYLIDKKIFIDELNNIKNNINKMNKTILNDNYTQSIITLINVHNTNITAFISQMISDSVKIQKASLSVFDCISTNLLNIYNKEQIIKVDENYTSSISKQITDTTKSISNKISTLSSLRLDKKIENNRLIKLHNQMVEILQFHQKPYNSIKFNRLDQATILKNHNTEADRLKAIAKSFNENMDSFVDAVNLPINNEIYNDKNNLEIAHIIKLKETIQVEIAINSITSVLNSQIREIIYKLIHMLELIAILILAIIFRDQNVTILEYILIFLPLLIYISPLLILVFAGKFPKIIDKFQWIIDNIMTITLLTYIYIAVKDPQPNEIDEETDIESNEIDEETKLELDKINQQTDIELTELELESNEIKSPTSGINQQMNIESKEIELDKVNEETNIRSNEMNSPSNESQFNIDKIDT